jgi:hydroxypyruvate reductase
MEGGHPLPDARSVQAGEKVLEFVSSLREDDTLVCLISGGGSALVTAPYVPLEDLQALTSLLLASGARIDEINTVRRQLERIKGGGLARATKARIISLILSDVIGNPLEAIASGPTVRDPTTREDALKIINQYSRVLTTESRRHGDNSFLNSVTQWLTTLEENRSSKPVVDDNSIFARVQNIIIGDNKLATQAAVRQAEEEKIHTEVLTNSLHGEAREVGVMLAKMLFEKSQRRKRPFCLIAGGETTVRVSGEGKGGRNQELALSAAERLRGMRDVLLVALATDGDDGPTDAAGAVVTAESADRAQARGLDAADYLSRNDAYPFFQELGDLIKTGPTGTNVNDLVFLCAL